MKQTPHPETDREGGWKDPVDSYLRDVQPLNKESARSHRFAMLVQELIGREPGFIDSYSAGIERFLKIKQKDRILTGEADNLFGNVVIEFEASLGRTRTEAEEQLRRYVAILWSQQSSAARTPYLCIATDGVRFISYSPTVSSSKTDITPDDVELQILEDADWTRLRPREIYFWLDRYFLRKEILQPTSETIVRDFGIKSHAFQSTTRNLLVLWQQIKTRNSFDVVFDSWDKYLRVVYGTQVAGETLFIRHTYLATLAKLMAWKRITESATLPEDNQIIELLEGQFFKAQGIENFIEEDFFSWITRAGAVKVGVAAARRLFSLLQNYDLSRLSEDVLKSLYQELVDPETRHDLGEFYTPDWLAHRIVRKLVTENPRAATLDPTCGSGTFIYLTIREKRQRLGDSLQTLQHILDSVYGADIHPLAVIIAKTNYILALGDLLKRRRGEVTIPIYLTDTIKLPTLERETKMIVMNGALEQKLSGYEAELDGRQVHLPEVLLDDLPSYDQAIELAKEYAQQSKGKHIAGDSFRNFLSARQFPHADNTALVFALYSIATTLKHFIDTDRDSIWAFVLKNIYKPLFFKRKFDFIVGNPPWIAYRYIEQPSYQAFLKRQITENYRLLKGRGELITHLELATLFLLRAADLYLKSDGSIAFVLPKSIFSADQHDGLRKLSFIFNEDVTQHLFWREVWDCENVSPLFNVPSCVLIAQKREVEQDKAQRDQGLPGQVLKGNLERKNATLSEAEGLLSTTDAKFSLHTRGRRSYWATGKVTKNEAASVYKSEFAQGATIVPRSFWFVEVKQSPLGVNPDLPLLETSTRAQEQAKDAYKTVHFKDTVESRFLYATLLSADLLPFGHLGYRLVVLPLEPREGGYHLVIEGEARKGGYLNLARWLGTAEKEWERRRGQKAERMSIYGRIDRVRGLTRQDPEAKYRVIYNTSGTFLTAAIVENEDIDFTINGQRLRARGYVADTKTYFCELNNHLEAFYLVSVLNAPVIDKLVKPLQSRGLWGPRDIHKKVLELPIPKFDAANPGHTELAEIGKDCSAKVEKWIADRGASKITSIGKLRSMVRIMLKDELVAIDALVGEIIK